MYPRTNYEMTEADLEKIIDACKPVPMIMLHIGGGPRSQQDRANDAWAELGTRMGFDPMTVQPISGQTSRFFSAIPSETVSQKTSRLAREEQDKKDQEINALKNDIASKQKRLSELTS